MMPQDVGFKEGMGFEPSIGPAPFPIDAVPRIRKDGYRTVRTTGWPRACAWGGVNVRANVVAGASDMLGSPPTILTPVHAIGIGLSLNESERRGVCGYLPIVPIWSGLAIDTLFYGTIAWGLLFLPGTLRRSRRRRGGRCLKCGYDRAGLASEAACPECGGAAAR
jgi:hypothetical protein